MRTRERALGRGLSPHVSAGCAPGATTQRSYGLVSLVFRTRRGPLCTIAGSRAEQSPTQGADCRLRYVPLLADASARRCSSRRTQENHDHAKKTVAGISGRSPIQAGKRSTTRKFSHQTVCGGEEPLLRSEEEFPSAVQCGD